MIVRTISLGTTIGKARGNIFNGEQNPDTSETKFLHQKWLWIDFGSVSRVYLLFGEKTCERKSKRKIVVSHVLVSRGNHDGSKKAGGGEGIEPRAWDAWLRH